MKDRPIQRSGKFAGQPYQKSQREYREKYGVAPATVKRWWRDGKPCDDPDAMGEFVSPRGRKAAEQVDADFEAPSIIPPVDADELSPAGLTLSPAALENLPVQLDETFFKGIGVLAEIERLQKAARERAGAYFSAISNRLGPQMIQNRFREWIGIVEALRKLEKAAPGIRKANELTIDVSEVEATWSASLAAIRATLRNLPGRSAAKLLSAPHDFHAYVEILEREVDAVMRIFRTEAEEAAHEADDEPAAANGNTTPQA